MLTYAQASVRFGGGLSATLGGRYSFEHQVHGR